MAPATSPERSGETIDIGCNSSASVGNSSTAQHQVDAAVTPGEEFDPVLRRRGESFKRTGSEVNKMLQRIVDLHGYVEGEDGGSNTTVVAHRRRRVPIENVEPEIIRALQIHLRQHQVARVGLRRHYSQRQPSTRDLPDGRPNAAVTQEVQAEYGTDERTVSSQVQVPTDRETGDAHALLSDIGK